MNETTPIPPSPSRPAGRARRLLAALAALGLLVLVAAAICEALGWPFLAAPLAGLLSDRLQRRVQFGDAAPTSPTALPFSIRFIGGVSLRTPRLDIAAPSWSDAPYLVSGRDVVLDLRYADLWRAWHGQPQRIESLRAAQLDAHLERRADGSASWQFGPPPAPGAVTPPLPSFGSLQVAAGTVSYSDAPRRLVVDARLSLVDGAGVAATRPAAGVAASAPAAVASAAAGSVLRVDASGHYGDSRLKIELLSSGVMPWATDASAAPPMPISLKAHVGRASLVFEGSAVDALKLRGLRGGFTLQGPSLAAVGDPIGVTLPTTAAFRTDGRLVEEGGIWSVVIDDARIGNSRLNGAFRFDAGRPVPLLAGRLGGTRLALTDLGPALGTAPKSTADGAAPAAAGASAPATERVGSKTRAAAAAPGPVAKPAQPAASAARTRTHGQGRVLPDRPFDLAALRAMDANVLIDIAEVDFDTPYLEPVRPLRAHLRLAGGVLSIADLDARTGQGRLMGDLSLDGRGVLALWTARLHWDGLRLEHFIHQTRAAGAPPYVAGRLSGRADLSGQGRSTADILGSLKGEARAQLHDGAVSHLLVEAAGLDIAQGLGMLIKGDDALPVQCGVADVVVAHGVIRPRVMVLDTLDSAIWIEGSMSLATEALDLRAVIIPKDFSPLALRTPIEVHGSLGQPVVSVQKGPLARKLGVAFLLGLINPLAALIPLIDTGNTEQARKGAAGCKGLLQRSQAKP